MLRDHGHLVIEYRDSNKRLETTNRLIAAGQAVWSRPAKLQVSQLIAHTCPDIVHVHNTFPAMSPSIYYACKEANLPVVQTLHNFRLLCPNGLLYRKKHICEDCLHKAVPWPAVLHGCWRDSRAQSTVPVIMLMFHRCLRTWHRAIDLYIALTEFGRRKFIEAGFPADKITVKPNFVCPDPGERKDGFVGDYALFVGRLSQEKGLKTLLQAWRHIPHIPLKIIGDGPLAQYVHTAKQQYALEMVDVLGHLAHQKALRYMKDARFLIVPSEWYEGFARTIVEALACGVPVVASELGAMAEIVSDRRTGLLFEPGDPEDLAATVEQAWTHPGQTGWMGHEARQDYERNYTAAHNHAMLVEIYHHAMDNV